MSPLKIVLASWSIVIAVLVSPSSLNENTILGSTVSISSPLAIVFLNVATLVPYKISMNLLVSVSFSLRFGEPSFKVTSPVIVTPELVTATLSLPPICSFKSPVPASFIILLLPSCIISKSFEVPSCNFLLSGTCTPVAFV